MLTHHNFEEKGEPKRYRTEVIPLTSLTARPNRLSKKSVSVSICSIRLFLLFCVSLSLGLYKISVKVSLSLCSFPVFSLAPPPPPPPPPRTSPDPLPSLPASPLKCLWAIIRSAPEAIMSSMTTLRTPRGFITCCKPLHLAGLTTQLATPSYTASRHGRHHDKYT